MVGRDRVSSWANRALLLRWLLVLAAVGWVMTSVLLLVPGAVLGVTASAMLAVSFAVLVGVVTIGVRRVLGVGVSLHPSSGQITVTNLHRTQRIWLRDIVSYRVVEFPWRRTHPFARHANLRPVPVIELRLATGGHLALHVTACEQESDRLAVLASLRGARLSPPASGYVDAAPHRTRTGDGNDSPDRRRSERRRARPPSLTSPTPEQMS